MKELLETILTIVSERRHLHSQKAEASKAKGNDTDIPQERKQAFAAMDFHEALAARYESLVHEIEQVICAELGDNWRETLS